jgi:hypothetical protein
LKFGREVKTPAWQAGLANRTLTLRDLLIEAAFSGGEEYHIRALRLGPKVHLPCSGIGSDGLATVDDGRTAWILKPIRPTIDDGSTNFADKVKVRRSTPMARLSFLSMFGRTLIWRSDVLVS